MLELIIFVFWSPNLIYGHRKGLLGAISSFPEHEPQLKQDKEVASLHRTYPCLLHP